MNAEACPPSHTRKPQRNTTARASERARGAGVFHLRCGPRQLMLGGPRFFLFNPMQKCHLSNSALYRGEIVAAGSGNDEIALGQDDDSLVLVLLSPLCFCASRPHP